MNETIRFFLFFIILWIIQGAALYYQNKLIHNKIQEFQVMGDLYIGVYKNKWGGRAFCFLIISDSTVKKVYILKGLTIFSKFRELNILEGRPINKLKEEFLAIKEISDNKKIYFSLLDAVDKFEKKKNERM